MYRFLCCFSRRLAGHPDLLVTRAGRAESGTRHPFLFDRCSRLVLINVHFKCDSLSAECEPLAVWTILYKLLGPIDILHRSR